MSQQASLVPFGPGQTFDDLETDTDLTTAALASLEGHEFEVEDYEAVSGATPVARRTGFVRRYRVVRNVSGVSLVAGSTSPLLVEFATTAGNYGRRIIGYNATLARKCYPIDDRLTATVTNNYLFLICVGGPHLCQTHPVGDGTNVIAVGEKIVGETAAASTFSTTAGRIVPITLSGATTALASQIMGYVGHALTARTTANTNTNTLVLIEHRWP